MKTAVNPSVPAYVREMERLVLEAFYVQALDRIDAAVAETAFYRERCHSLEGAYDDIRDLIRNKRRVR